MKRLSIIFFVLISFCSFGQTPSFKWVKRIPFEISCQCTDNEDNIYIAGNIHDTTNFENSTLYPQNGILVVAKIDSSGSLLWYRQFGGNIYDYPIGIKIDHNGDLVIADCFDYSTIYFGDTIVAVGHGAVLTKLSKNGDLIWYEVPGYNNIGCFHVFMFDVDQENNIIISGDLQWGGSGIFTDTIISINDTVADFRAKYNSNGDFLWVRKSVDVNDQIIFDYSNNILVFSGKVQKFSDNNSLIWERQSNVWFPNANSWPKVAVDSLDNSYIASSFDLPFYIGSDTLVPNDSSRFIFVKLNSSGIPILTRSATSTKSFSPNSISISKNKVGITGTFKDKLFFDNDSLTSVSNIKNNSFISLYDVAGNIKFIKKIDGKFGCSSQLISVSKSIYVSGYSIDTTYFDNIALIQGNGPYSKGYFLARLQDEVVHPIFYPETFELFPNPTLGSLTIKLNPSYLNATLEIYDIEGKLIDRYYLDTYFKTMNLDHLSKGLYFIKIKTNEKTFINKFEKI